MSPVATHHNRPGALAFAMFWFQALDWGYATTDSTLAKTLYTKSCTDCARFMHNFDDAKARGEHYRGGRSVVIATYLAENDHRSRADCAVDVTLDIPAWDVLAADGAVINHGAARSAGIYRVWLRWLNEGWSIVDYKRGIA